MKLSENFSLHEFERSHTAKIHGIANKATGSVLENIKLLVTNVLQPARTALGIPINIGSGYRSPELNKKVKGAKFSQHMFGMAADLKCENNRALFVWLLHNTPFDQLIWEYGDDNQPQWVHVSFDKNRSRKQVLRIDQNGRRVLQCAP